MLVGEWRRIGEAAARNALADSLRRAAHRASRAARRAGLDVDDVASAAWFRLASRGMLDISRASDETPLDAWTAGVVRVVVADAARERRKQPTAAGGHERLATIPAREEEPDSDGGIGASTWTRCVAKRRPRARRRRRSRRSISYTSAA